MKNKTKLFAFVCTLIFALSSTVSLADSEVYFIRHADVDLDSKKKPLTDAGKQRAKSLVSVMSGKTLTHILVTDYPRTKNTAKPISEDRNLDIKVIPYKGKKAIKPMVSALNDLPDGSKTLVVANSGNLFQIMSKMGVSTNDSMPCNSKKCFDRKAFDNIWHVIITNGGVTMEGSKY